MGEEATPGQGMNPPEATPGAPETAPEAGQTVEGQAEGQGAPEGHQLDPNLTKAQQRAANAEREAEYLRKQMDTLMSQQPQSQDIPADPQEREMLEAFDKMASKSKVVQTARTDAQNMQAIAIDTQLAANPSKYPAYQDPEVRQAIVNQVSQMGQIPVTQLGQAVENVYRMHAYQKAAQQAQTYQSRIAQLEAELDKAKSGNVDVGGLRAAGGMSAGEELTPPTMSSSTDEHAAYIDEYKRRHGLN
jgi:hypothetical protein